MADFAHHQLANKVLVQGQAAQFRTVLKPDDPFPYLGVHITMDLNWTHQPTHMTTKLSLKLERLKNYFASPKQTMDTIRTAIVPSIANSFPITPCSLSVLNQWDTQTLAAIKSKYKPWMCTLTALLWEDNLHYGLGCSSLRIEFHYRNALALITSLYNEVKHGRLTETLLEHQTQQLNTAA